MAAVDWPWNLCVIRTQSHRRGNAPDSRRTKYEDGYIDQRRYGTVRSRRRTFTIAVKESNREAFETWVDTHGNSFVNWTDIGDATPNGREVRIIGGQVELEYQDPNTRLDGEKYWEAQVQLEFFG